MHHIKSLCFFIAFIIVSGYTFADSPAKLCTISGIVSDSISREGLPYAAVQLYSSNDEVVKGAMTDIDGNYTIEGIMAGTYRAVASYMGYVQSEKVIRVSEKKTIADFRLESKSLSLDTYELTAEKSLTENTIEKTTVNVTKNLTLSEGSATDVMTTLPSVDIDIDGNLNYRGNDKVTVLLNGQRSELTMVLDQIPASQIEKVEIINNPSAKYEADGMSGIINIVLKTGNQQKNKTTFQLNAGLPETFGGNIGFTQIREKSSFFVSGGYQHKTKFQTKEHLRRNYEAPDGFNYYQFDRMDDNLNNAIFTTSYNYNINKRQQIGISLTGSKKFNHADRSINYQTQYQHGGVESGSTKEIDISLDNNNLESDIHYRLGFAKEGQELRAKVHYSLLDQLQQMDNRHYTSSNDEPALQNTALEQYNITYNASLDYIHPLKENLKFETGYNLNVRDLSNDFSSESFDYDESLWTEDLELNNQFHYMQQVNALYTNLTGKWNRFSFQAGLRAEYVKTAQNDVEKDKYLDIFPSANISLKTDKKNSFYSAYTRRINRPTIKMLNPYTDEYADIMNQHRGNPELMPEYVNSFELGHRYTGKKVSGSVALFYRDINQAISRVKSASNDSALYVTFMNLDKARMPGAEISVSYHPVKWWNMNIGGNIFNTTLVGSYAYNDVNKSMTGWNLNASTAFKLKGGVGIQLYGYYRSSLPSVMGTYIHRYYMDAAISKKVLKNKGRLVFKVSDVFNSYRFGLDLDAIDANGYHYSQSNRRKNESQYFILSFIYNIDGKQQKKGPTTNFFLDSFDK